MNMDIEDVFLESNFIKSCKSQLENEFEHMIKFEVCKHNQDTSWITSINVAASMLSKMSKNDKKEIEKIIDDCYIKGRNRAYTHLVFAEKGKRYEWFTDISPESRPDDWDLKLLSSPSDMTKWMKVHAYTPNVRDGLGVYEILREKDKSKMIAKYDSKTAFPNADRIKSF